MVQTLASPVLGDILQQAKVKNGMRYIKIPGVPHQAVYAFVRFLYSSWYVEGVLFLLVPPLSHSVTYSDESSQVYFLLNILMQL